MRRAQREYAWALTFASIVAIFAAVVLWNMGRERSSSDEFRLAHAGNEIADDETIFDDQSAASGITPSGIEKPSTSPHPNKLDERVASTAAGDLEQPARTPEDRPDSVSEHNRQEQSSESQADSDVRGAEPSRGYAAGSSSGSAGAGLRSIGRSSSGPAMSASGGGAVASSAGVKSSSEPANTLDGLPQAQTQNSSRRAKVGDSAPADDSPAPTTATYGTGPSVSSGPSSSSLSPEAAASPDIGLTLAPFEAGSAPSLTQSSGAFADTESGLTESLLGEPDFTAPLITGSGDPITALQESIAGVETPALTPAATTPLVVNPEPASLLLLGTGLGFLAHRLRRRQQPAAK